VAGRLTGGPRDAPAVWQRLAPPATERDIAAVEEAHGFPLPADLAAWWRRSDGVTPGAGGTASVIPGGHFPATTRGAVKNLVFGRRMAARQADEDPGYAGALAELRTQPAGSVSDLWARPDEWITISEDSDALFVDCRGGELHGCVMMRFVTGGQIGPLWPGVAAMWREAADILEAIDPGAPPTAVMTSAGLWEIPGTWWFRDS